MFVKVPSLLAFGAFLLAVAAFGALLFAKIGVSVQRTDNSPAVTRYVSLPESQGWGVTISIAIPVLIAATPLAPIPARLKTRVRIMSAVLLSCFVVLSILSVGTFYAPSAALMVVAAALREESASAT